MKTIFNTYIEVESQEQADRLKQVCIDNGLKIWKNEVAFELLKNDKKPIFYYDSYGFCVVDFNDINEDDYKLKNTQVTEPEWMELLKQHKK